MPVSIDELEPRQTHLGDWQGLTHHEVDAIARRAAGLARHDCCWAASPER